MTAAQRKSTGKGAESTEARESLLVKLPPAVVQQIAAYALITGQHKQDVIEQAFRCLLAHTKLPPDQARKFKVFLGE